MKCLHMSIKILAFFEMQPKWNFMWIELAFMRVWNLKPVWVHFASHVNVLRVSPCSKSCERWSEILSRSKMLKFLRFFTCVSWGIFPVQILLIVQTTAIRHSIFYFSSFSMFIQSRISKSVVICSFCSFLCSFLLSIFSILLFSTLLSIPCSLFSLCLFTLFSDLPYCFLFKSVILSFLFSYYSVLSASSLYSITIQSVLFLLVFIFLDPSI